MENQIYAEGLVKEFKIRSKKKFFSIPEIKVLKAVDNVNLKIF